MQSLTKDMTDGLYAHAKSYVDPATSLKAHPIQYLGMHAENAGVFPDDEKLDRLTERHIEKMISPAWYKHNREKMSVSEGFGWVDQIRDVVAAKWVLNEYFKDRPNKTVMTGRHADSMEKAFTVSPAELTVFPFFWDTLIVESILAVPLLDVLVADTVNVNSGTAVHAVMNETVLDRSIGITGEFGSFQEVNVTSTESTVRLIKFGGQITISDEAMRRQRIPVFQRGFARYGRQIGIDITDLMIDIILNGDSTYGGSTSAVPTVAAAVPGTPVYSDYVKAMFTFNIGYEPTDYLMSKSGFTKQLNVPEFKDPLAGFKFQSQGVLPEMFGLMPHRWDSIKSTSWSPGGVVGDSTTERAIQRGRLLSLYQEGGLSTESDRDPRVQATTIVTSWYLIGALLDRLAGVSLTGVA